MPDAEPVSEGTPETPSLRALAERATPGPWQQGEKSERSAWDHRRFVYCDDVTGSRVADCSTAGAFIDDPTRLANATFIAAANPAAILALLDELESSRAALREAQEDTRRLNWLDRQRRHVPAAWGYHDERYTWAIDGRGADTAEGTTNPNAQFTLRAALDAAASEAP